MKMIRFQKVDEDENEAEVEVSWQVMWLWYHKGQIWEIWVIILILKWQFFMISIVKCNVMIPWSSYVILTSSLFWSNRDQVSTYTFCWSNEAIAYISILWCQSLPVICLQLGSWRWLPLETRKASLTPEATDLLKTIMMCMNWRDIWTAGRRRIGSLVEKDVSFLVSTLRKCERSKQVLHVAWDLLMRNPVTWRSSCFQMMQLESKRFLHASWRMID